MKQPTNLNTQQTGYTLIELMIGLIVGLIVLSVVLYAFVTMLVGSRDIINSSRLNSETSYLGALIADDIRRAGYWFSTASVAVSPFSGSSTADLSFPASDCVLFSFDANEDQVVSAGASSEHRGYRLNSSGSIGFIEVKTFGDPTSTGTTGNCVQTNDTWQPLTDSDTIDITLFNVGLGAVSGGNCSALSSTSGACSSATEYSIIRYVDIELEAEVNEEWKGRFSESVRVQNDAVFR